jgi:site-specific DNA-methyltransferase (adenine-specific)
MKLLNGDCLELMKTIPDNSIDMVLTDPPYKLVAGGRVGKNTPKGGIFSEYDKELKSGKIFKYNNINFNEWVPELKRIAKDKTHILIFCNGRNLNNLLTESLKHFSYKNILVWNKSNKTPNRSYMQQVEFILMLGNNGCRGINNMGCSNLLDYKNKIGNKVHPTEKPVDLLSHLIENSTNEGDTILDMFMGSGSTGVACKNLGRKFIGIEQDLKYFEIAKERISNHEKI